MRPAKAQNTFKNNRQLQNTNYYKPLSIDNENEIYLSDIKNEEDNKS